MCTRRIDDGRGEVQVAGPGRRCRACAQPEDAAPAPSHPRHPQRERLSHGQLMSEVLSLMPTSRLLSPSRRALRVPEITAYFWIVKALSTAMGESTSDYLVHTLHPVPAVLLGFAGFLVALALQLSMRRYLAWTYWFAVVMVGVFGTAKRSRPWTPMERKPRWRSTAGDGGLCLQDDVRGAFRRAVVLPRLFRLGFHRHGFVQQRPQGERAHRADLPAQRPERARRSTRSAPATSARSSNSRTRTPATRCATPKRP